MAGYSGTSLPKKLGIKEGHTVGVFGAPDHVEKTLGKLPHGTTLLRDPRISRKLNVAVAFFTSERRLRRRFPHLKKRLVTDGGLWIAWPKQSSPLSTELRESHVRSTGLEGGLVDNRICAVDEDWSGLRFVYRREDR